MKKIALVILILGLASCVKEEMKCIHMHVGGSVLEYCSKNVVCEESKNEDGTTVKMCGLQENVKQ